MSSITKHQDNIRIDMTGGTFNQPVFAKQGDRAARYVKVTLYDQDKLYTIPTDAIVSAYIKRPDDICIYVPCTFSGSTVTADLASNALAVAGMARCEIEVKSSDATEVLTSCTFKVRIEPNVKDLDAEPSENQLTEIDVQLKKIADSESARVEAENKRASAEKARVSAEITRESKAMEAQNKVDTAASNIASNEKNFNTWFNSVKGQVTNDMAVKLQNEINGIWASEKHPISTSGWTTKTIDGVSYQAYAITLTNNFDPSSVTVSLCAANNKELPTETEGKAYGTPICVINGKTLYFCKTAAPSTAFTIQISGKTA